MFMAEESSIDCCGDSGNTGNPKDSRVLSAWGMGMLCSSTLSLVLLDGSSRIGEDCGDG